MDDRITSEQWWGWLANYDRGGGGWRETGYGERRVKNNNNNNKNKK